MAVWPVTLPTKPLYAGNEEQLPDLVIRTQMTTGPEKVRRRFTSGVRRGHWEWLMTTAQLSTFKTFFEDTCAGGALTWTITHPIFGGTATLRFVGQPKYAMVSASRARVAFDYEVLP